jgi:hypothetical protein
MGVFTTNWYLYKTHFHSIQTKTQTRNSDTATEVYGSKKRQVQKWRSKRREF